MFSSLKQKGQLKAVLLGAFSLIAAIVPNTSLSAETLEEALASAYNSNPKLLAERARLREIDETYIQARAQGRLNASAGANFSLDVTRTPALSIPVPGFDSFIESGTTFSTPASANVRLIQPVYQNGRVRALKSQAMSGVMAAREGLRATETNLLLNVATSYVDVLRDEEIARVRRNNVMVLMRQKEGAEARFEVGAGSKTDMAQAEARLAAAKLGLAQADASLQSSRASYRQYTGHLPENLQPLPVIAMPDNENDVRLLAKQSNPALRAAVFQEEAADAAINAAKASYGPNVSLTGSLSAVRGQAGFPDRAENGVLGAQLTVPIMTGGEAKSRVRAAKHAKDRLRFETRDVERQIDASIMQAWAGLMAANEALLASDAQINAAELALEGVELERDLGTRTALDVLNAEQELLNAQLSLIDSRSELAKARYRLLALAGAFDAVSLNLPIDYYRPEENLENIEQSGVSGAIDQLLPEKWR